MSIQFPSSKIKIVKHTLQSNLKNNLKVVHISDLHLGYYSNLKDLHQLVLLINQQEADIVCFTGDCFDNINDVSFDPYLVIPLFRTIQSKYGKFFVPGNHDYGSNGIDIVLDIMNKSGFQSLLNDYFKIMTPDGNILIHGIDDICFGQPNFNSSFQTSDEHVDYRIGLMHEPDKVKLLDPYINLVLSGHTHGGQVRIPIIGAIYTPTFGKNYIQGLYHIRNEQYLFVNKGIGMTRLPIRIFCSPEIAVFNLKPKHSE
ncbi:metallophosphoesterase [Mammaliicoccus vitulinus]|uniref:metallophosphoesterase n=1 Tax=Mammaliicoccus vitulinus TaxID=71237 RepID=UPI003B9DC7EF